MKALVVTTDAALAGAAREALLQRGHQVEIVDDIERCVREDPGPMLVVVDGPGADGDVASSCNELRASSKHDAPFVLFVGTEAEVAVALDAGADDVHLRSSGLPALETRLRIAERLVTERSRSREQETRVREATAFVDSIVDHVPLMIFVKDAAELRFQRFNLAGEAMIGLRQEELLGKNDFDFFPAEQAAFFIAKDRETLRQRTVVNIEEEPIQTARGERWLHTMKTAICGPDGAPTHLLGISEDITERRELAEALGRAREDLERRVAERTADLAKANAELRREMEEREKLQAHLLQVQKLESLGLLAGGIAHDFNNMLTAILGEASIALATVGAENPAHDEIENVIAAAHRAASLTRQMLAYSGRGHVDVRPIELSAHVRELGALLETTVPKRVQLRLELSPGLPAIDADVAQVQQVIMNLVINAA
jgi:PAS domain S-box-containing protein